MDIPEEQSKFRPRSDRAQKYHDNIYRPRRDELIRRIEKTPLSIVIWGPGEGGGPLYNKRVDILNQLRANGLDAFFSEEESQDPQLSTLPSEKAKEYVQASVAELVVVLRVSYGSVAEVHDFADFHDIASKMLVFVDSKTFEGYSTMGAIKELRELHGKIESFHYPEDINNCKLLTSVINKVRLMQHAKFRALRSASQWGS